MKKTIKNSVDFFTLYRSNQFKKFLFSWTIAVFAAFSIISFIHGGIDTRGLMASVANITELPPLDANLVLKKQGNVLSVIFGAKASKVDRIDLNLLSDPTRIHSLESSHKAVTILGKKEEWAYHISINMAGIDLSPGTHIADMIIHIDEWTAIALTDAEFLSESTRYNMTSTVEY